MVKHAKIGKGPLKIYFQLKIVVDGHGIYQVREVCESKFNNDKKEQIKKIHRPWRISGDTSLFFAHPCSRLRWLVDKLTNKGKNDLIGRSYRERAMILDEQVPTHHFSERHSVITQTTPRRLYDSIVTIDLSASPLVRFLYSLRRMPTATLTLEGMKEIGFSVLGMQEEREYVIGLVGRFRKPVPEIIDIRPDTFASFNEKRYAKAALNFLIGESLGGNRLLSTETRIYCTSLDARIRFSAYWALIRPFSGLIRRAMLKEILRGAERLRG